MHPVYLDALRNPRERHGDRAGGAVAGLFGAADRADEALARRAQQNRAAKPMKQRQIVQQGQVVLQRLAEADAGIGDDPVAGMPAFSSAVMRSSSQS